MLDFVLTTVQYVDVLPVLWMTSCFHIMEPMGQNQDDAYVSASSPAGGTSRTSNNGMCGLVRESQCGSTDTEGAVYDCRLLLL